MAAVERKTKWQLSVHDILSLNSVCLKKIQIDIESFRKKNYGLIHLVEYGVVHRWKVTAKTCGNKPALWNTCVKEQLLI